MTSGLAHTKQGEHGTLYRYHIEYTDDSDPGCPVMTWCTWAYSEQGAVERFHDGPDADGWKPLRIARSSNKPRSEWCWHPI